MKNHRLIKILIIIILLTGFSIAQDSCPYCGQTYGAVAPWDDEAKINALRRAHEASCPSRSEESLGRQAEQTGKFRQALIHYVEALKADENNQGYATYL